MTMRARFLRVACASLVLALLAGCAAQMVYREGQDLLARGDTAGGLARFEEASRLDPRVAEYRIAVLRTRERYLAAQLAQAEALRREGRLDEAQELLRALVPAGAREEPAIAAARALSQERIHNLLLAEAQSAADRKDVNTARSRLKTILLEHPNHEGAMALARKLDQDALKAAPETALAAAYRRPITIEFKDAALRNVFEVISRSSGLNFIFDKEVRTDQKTSIYLKNSTIESAVQLTLLTNQLDRRVLDGNTVLIYPNNPAKQREYQSLLVRGFYLANADAKTVAASLKALLRARDIVVDEKLNLLIMRDSPEAIRIAEKLIALHDVPEAEVMLEVEILEVKRTRLLDLGIRWPDTLTLTPLAASGGALTLADLRNLNSSQIGAGIGQVTLTARKNDSDANILANPRIRVRNHEKAKILIGEKVPNITTVLTATGFSSESVSYVDVGLKLDVEPTIYLDNEVAIKIALEVSNIISQVQTKSGSVAYQIGTRTASTVLRLKDGENQVLAGLINDEDRRSSNKVPLVGDVPLIGRLFGAHSDDSSKTEIVLSITPRIIRNVRRPDAQAMEFDTGTENGIGARASSPSGPQALSNSGLPPGTTVPGPGAVFPPTLPGTAPQVRPRAPVDAGTPGTVFAPSVAPRTDSNPSRSPFQMPPVDGQAPTQPGGASPASSQ